jgi:hypothetical protein
VEGDAAAAVPGGAGGDGDQVAADGGAAGFGEGAAGEGPGGAQQVAGDGGDGQPGGVGGELAGGQVGEGAVVEVGGDRSMMAWSRWPASAWMVSNGESVKTAW